MKNLIYGCGRILRYTLEKFDVEYENLDFTDSNNELWGTEYMCGKSICSVNEINVSNYDFCIIGSKQYGKEIREEIKKLGFKDNQIIPFEYINSLWERWKKKQFHDFWLKVIEDEKLSVIKNWHIEGSDAASIIKLKGLCLYNIKFKAFDLYANKRKIEVYDISKCEQLLGDFSANEMVSFRCNSDEMIIKLVVKDAVVGIPWCMLMYSKDEVLCQIDNCKLGKQLVNTYNRLQEFPYYDEDYTVLNSVSGCNGTILDVGANYGQSMYAFYNSSECNIVSVEVSPDLCEVLWIMKQLIDRDDRISIIESGVSDKNEDLVWYEPSDPMMAGSFDEDFIYGRKLGVEITEKIMKCRPLDELVDSYENIWFVKMDVEGLEYEALQGAKKIIEKNHPVILIEQNNKIAAIEKLLGNQYDLMYYDLYEDMFKPERISRLNCWLIPKAEYRSSNVKKLIEGRI